MHVAPCVLLLNSLAHDVEVMPLHDMRGLRTASSAHTYARYSRFLGTLICLTIVQAAAAADGHDPQGAGVPVAVSLPTRASHSDTDADTESSLITQELKLAREGNLSKHEVQARLKELHESRSLGGNDAHIRTHTFETVTVFMPELYLERKQRLGPAANCDLPNIPGATKIVLLAGSPLEPVKDWLWRHSEYVGHEWLDQWLYCRAKRAPTAATADLCYPGCTRTTKMNRLSVSGRWKAQQMFLHVHNNKKFMGCSKLSIQMERVNPFTSRCDVTIPYFHGVYAPGGTAATWSVTPWTLGLPRTNFLGFAGSTQRGGRGRMVVEMLEYSFIHSAKSTYASLFQAPFQTEHVANTSILIDSPEQGRTWRTKMVAQVRVRMSFAATPTLLCV